MKISRLIQSLIALQKEYGPDIEVVPHSDVIISYDVEDEYQETIRDIKASLSPVSMVSINRIDEEENDIFVSLEGEEGVKRIVLSN